MTKRRKHRVERRRGGEGSFGGRKGEAGGSERKGGSV